ncbi:ribonuclease P [Candidatus Woesearchaeota archaeon]|nr:ribonuclease P [Candidatus Woesearchaeota archaeon]
MPKPLFSKGKQKDIARERLAILSTQAEKVFPQNKSLANRYVFLARKIAMKSRLPLPKEFKRRFCKHCNSYLQPGVNSRIRTRQGKVIISCFECKKFTRIPVR